MSWAKDEEELFRVIVLSMADHNPFSKVDAVYLFGHTPDNELSILKRGLILYQQEFTKHLVLDGGQPYRPPNSPPEAPVAYSGGEKWRRWLIDNGVAGEDISTIPIPKLAHTGTDAFRFVKFAEMCEWKVVTVVACPLHMPRAFANTVAVINRNYPQLLAYACPGCSDPWDEKVVSSQGNVFGQRMKEGISAEWARLTKIHGNKYDVTETAAEVIEYMERRDTKVRALLAPAV